MLKFIFGDKTIKNAVNKVLAERVSVGQSKFNDVVSSLEAKRDAEKAEAEARFAAEKDVQAREIASSILGK